MFQRDSLPPTTMSSGPTKANKLSTQENVKIPALVEYMSKNQPKSNAKVLIFFPKGQVYLDKILPKVVNFFC